MTIIWATILVLGVLITIHELGHFIAARSVGVRVERFSIGMPPRFLSVTSEDNGWMFRLFFYKSSGGKIYWQPVFEKLIGADRIGSGTEYVLALLPKSQHQKLHYEQSVPHHSQNQ